MNPVKKFPSDPPFPRMLPGQRHLWDRESLSLGSGNPDWSDWFRFYGILFCWFMIHNPHVICQYYLQNNNRTNQLGAPSFKNASICQKKTGPHRLLIKCPQGSPKLPARKHHWFAKRYPPAMWAQKKVIGGVITAISRVITPVTHL